MIEPKEIEKCNKSYIKAINANVQLSNANWLKQNNCSCFNQETNISNLFNNKSVANSDLEDKYIDLITNELFNLLITKTEDNLQSKKSKKQISKINTTKQASFFNEIFDYIHTTQYTWLFSLAWYDNQTYTSASKWLPNICCNGPSCNSEPFDYHKKTLFIDNTSAKLSEID